MPTVYVAGEEPVFQNTPELLPSDFDEFLALGMRVIAMNSQFEMAAGQLMTMLLGLDNRAGSLVFEKLRSAQLQGQALMDVASLRMPEEDQARLKSLLGLARQEAVFRDILAHGSWGVDPNRPNCVVVLDGIVIPRLLNALDLDGEMRRGSTIWDRDAFKKHARLAGDIFLGFNSMIALTSPESELGATQGWRDRIDYLVAGQAQVVAGFKGLLKGRK